jgi:hypothetical protein
VFRVGCARGQASVEIIAVVPVLVLAAGGAFEALAAGAGHELAGHAAEAGAIALAEGGDARAAAEAAVPGWSRAGLRVRVHGSRVDVRLRPLAPARALGDLLASEATADAGRAP